MGRTWRVWAALTKDQRLGAFEQWESIVCHWEALSRRSGCQRSWVRALFRAANFSLRPHVARALGSSWGLFYKGTDPLMTGPHLQIPHHVQGTQHSDHGITLVNSTHWSIIAIRRASLSLNSSVLALVLCQAPCGSPSTDQILRAPALQSWQRGSR